MVPSVPQGSHWIMKSGNDLADLLPLATPFHTYPLSRAEPIGL